MTAFQFNTVSDLRVGAGAAQQLGALCQQLGITKPLIVTDPGLVQIRHRIELKGPHIKASE